MLQFYNNRRSLSGNPNDLNGVPFHKCSVFMGLSGASGVKFQGIIVAEGTNAECRAFTHHGLKCRICGASLETTDARCDSCGEPVERTTPSQ